MNDVMIDFETLGVSPEAVIVQVAGVYFDRYTGETYDEILINIDIQSVIDEGFIMDWSTINFWLSQNKEAQQSVFDNAIDRVKIIPAMKEFNDFLKMPYTSIWSHKDFDFVLLRNYLKLLGIEPTFDFRAGKDIRTLTDLANISSKDYPREGIHHNALDDCKFQIKYCVDCFNQLKQK